MAVVLNIDIKSQIYKMHSRPPLCYQHAIIPRWLSTQIHNPRLGVNCAFEWYKFFYLYDLIISEPKYYLYQNQYKVITILECKKPFMIVFYGNNYWRDNVKMKTIKMDARDLSGTPNG